MYYMFNFFFFFFFSSRRRHMRFDRDWSSDVCSYDLHRECIHGPKDVYERCAPALRDLPQEEFHVLLVNTQNALLRALVITRGTLDTSVVHPDRKSVV